MRAVDVHGVALDFDLGEPDPLPSEPVSMLHAVGVPVQRKPVLVRLQDRVLGEQAHAAPKHTTEGTR